MKRAARSTKKRPEAGASSAAGRVGPAKATRSESKIARRGGTGPHACFVCRLAFRRAPRDKPPRCPRCRRRLYEMGRAFRAPHRGDREQWLKFQSLYALGFRFTKARGVRPPLPRFFHDVLGFVALHPEHALRTEPPDEEAIPDDLKPPTPAPPRRRKPARRTRGARRTD